MLTKVGSKLLQMTTTLLSSAENETEETAIIMSDLRTLNLGSKVDRDQSSSKHLTKQFIKLLNWQDLELTRGDTPRATTSIRPRILCFLWSLTLLNR